MPRLSDLLVSPSMARGEGQGTVIQTASGPMLVMPDGRVMPVPPRGGIPGVNGAMPSPAANPGVVMPGPILGDRG